MESLLLDAAGHRRSPATVPGYHQGRVRGTRAFAIRPIRRRSRRSSQSCAPRVMSLTVLAYAR